MAIPIYFLLTPAGVIIRGHNPPAEASRIGAEYWYLLTPNQPTSPSDFAAQIERLPSAKTNQKTAAAIRFLRSQ